MPVRCEEYGNVCVVTIEGDLAGENAASLRKGVDELVNARHLADFIADLEKCSFIDSEGLESLLWLKRRSEELFGQLKLVCLDENCRKILEITRLECRFECQQDLSGALKIMR
jgi:anti-anti-sigma factor